MSTIKRLGTLSAKTFGSREIVEPSRPPWGPPTKTSHVAQPEAQRSRWARSEIRTWGAPRTSNVCSWRRLRSSPARTAGFGRTSWTLFAVPGVVAFNSPVPVSTMQTAATIVNRDFIMDLRWDCLEFSNLEKRSGSIGGGRTTSWPPERSTFYTRFAFCNIVAVPIPAGPLVPLGLDLSMGVGAVAMSLSTIVVAANGQLLRRLKLQHSA